MKKNFIILAGMMTIAGTAVGLGVNNFASAASNNTASNTVNKHKTRSERHLVLRVRLNQAVRDGTISSAQKKSILNELKTLNQERKSDLTKSSTTAERQAERAKIKSQLVNWASTNNFPLAKIFPHLAS